MALADDPNSWKLMIVLGLIIAEAIYLFFARVFGREREFRGKSGLFQLKLYGFAFSVLVTGLIWVFDYNSFVQGIKESFIPFMQYVFQFLLGVGIFMLVFAFIIFNIKIGEYVRDYNKKKKRRSKKKRGKR